MTKAEFITATKGKYNCIVEFEGYIISITGWKDKGWEVVKDKDFKITSDREYKPVAAFRTREELWSYIKYGGCIHSVMLKTHNGSRCPECGFEKRGY